MPQAPIEIAPTRIATTPPDDRLLDLRLTPHRSLGRGQFQVLMSVFALAAIASSTPFVIAGAWPVGGFMGLDILVVYLAFRANFRAARAYEDISVTPLELQLAKVSAQGRRAEWRFHPAWVALDKVEHEDFGLLRLALRSRGESVEVAGFLGADAKADVASQLTRALAEARRGPRFS